MPIKTYFINTKKACHTESGKKGKVSNRKKRSKRSRISGKRKIKTIRLSSRNILLIVVAVAVFFAIPFLIRHDAESGAKVPEGNFRYGIDISHHNFGEPNWDSLKVLIGPGGKTVRKIKAANTILPVTFMFIKATEGIDFKDKHFKRNWIEAGKRKYARGAYHFFRSSKDPALQAYNFINFVGELRHIDLPPVLDVETIHIGCSYKELNDNVSLWLKIVEDKYGRKPIIYTSEHFADNVLSTEIITGYPLWIAHYGISEPERDDWTYWQFTDRAVVYGINGFVDLNVIRIK